MICIYKITNPEGKVYIGKTVEFRRRMYEHQKSPNCTKLHRSVQKYGWDSHKVEVLEEVSEIELNIRESMYVNFYDSVSNGLNIITPDVNGTPSGKDHPLHGRKRPQEVIDKIKATKAKNGFEGHWKGKKMPPRSDEYRANVAKRQKGRKHSPETIAKMRESAKNRKKKLDPIQ